ncbi:MAG: hypothetical protein ACRDSR_07040 [Pseudonocardiaceae bacterium]
MTQDDLATAAGVSTDLVRKLEQGRRHTASDREPSPHRVSARRRPRRAARPRQDARCCAGCWRCRAPAGGCRCG